MTTPSFSDAAEAARDAARSAGLPREAVEHLVQRLRDLAAIYGDTFPREAAERLVAAALSDFAHAARHLGEVLDVILDETEGALARARATYNDRAARRRTSRR